MLVTGIKSYRLVAPVQNSDWQDVTDSLLYQRPSVTSRASAVLDTKGKKFRWSNECVG